MPRANLNKARAVITAAVEQAVTKLQAERELDSAHIESHADISKAQQEKIKSELTRFEEYLEQTRKEVSASFDSMLTGVRALFAEMLTDEEKRHASFIAHANDINDDGSDEDTITLPDKKPMRALTGGRR